MSDMLTKIEKKLLEYGFDIYDQYKVENEQYLFLVNDMVIFVDIESGDISISFQATTKPDVVANNVLILKEIPDLKKLFIMDSFIFTENRRMVRGDEAYELIKQSVENAAVKEYIQKMTYSSILVNADCHKC